MKSNLHSESPSQSPSKKRNIELGMATPKLRANVSIDRWPQDRIDQVLEWIDGGDSLRAVARKIRDQFGIVLHHATVAKFYTRERQRRLRDLYNETLALSARIGAASDDEPIDYTQVMENALGMEFLRSYSSGKLSPSQVLLFGQLFYKQRQQALTRARLALDQKKYETDHPATTPGANAALASLFASALGPSAS